MAKHRIDQDEAEAVAERVVATAEVADLVGCQLVVETVVEDLAAKVAILTEVDRVVGPEVVLASNTSTLPIVELAVAVTAPERVCGMHFFNPAPVMKLVEIVAPITASEETVATATEFAQACGKEPVRVKDRAGFVVNALLFPYLNNAVRLLDQGVADRDGIDLAMRGGCGFPMGPLALLDLVGLDTSLAILQTLHAEYADPNYAPVPLLRRLVTAGHLGRKSGQGFYAYEDRR
ncbi:MAG: 3-hydroxyacyl-CoA dehydrogenase NAD-binding domain-containing protein [Acidimicrobiales bacterium]